MTFHPFLIPLHTWGLGQGHRQSVQYTVFLLLGLRSWKKQVFKCPYKNIGILCTTLCSSTLELRSKRKRKDKVFVCKSITVSLVKPERFGYIIARITITFCQQGVSQWKVLYNNSVCVWDSAAPCWVMSIFW